MAAMNKEKTKARKKVSRVTVEPSEDPADQKGVKESDESKEKKTYIRGAEVLGFLSQANELLDKSPEDTVFRVEYADMKMIAAIIKQYISIRKSNNAYRRKVKPTIRKIRIVTED